MKKTFSERRPVLSVSDVRYERGPRIILDHINWQVRAGEHWVILGPNGCGKTSLINLLTGYDMATEGEIDVGDARFGESDWREVRKHIGLVASTLTFYLEPGEPVLDAVVSGREAMINLIGDVKPALVREARVLLKRFGCEHLVDSRWGVLSQGERQKILICRALMAKFRVLILDEPCAGLDPVAREHFLSWLQALAARRGAPSLVLVTHHVEEILPCFNRVLLMKDGKVLASGEKAKVLTSAKLSYAYGAKLKLTQGRNRYRLKLL
ncbi:MAG: ATP-binding cassette domain-containing protein [Verrucomicrobiaceae bacterium]